jgi:AraC-like DNA-binding protein
MISLQPNNCIELMLLSEFYKLVALLSNQNKNMQTVEPNISQNYITQAIEFITSNYNNKITITSIAATIGLNRSYFCEIFKKATGKSPQTFLIDYRIAMSLKLLENKDLRVSDVARSVGYVDPQLFSRTFKSKQNLSPLQFRNNQNSDG